MIKNMVIQIFSLEPHTNFAGTTPSDQTLFVSLIVNSNKNVKVSNCADVVNFKNTT